MTAKSRRSLLQGGLTALAGVVVAACDRAPDPYALEKPPVPGAGGRFEGEEHLAATACALCPLGCGIKVRVVEGRAVKVEGDPAHPIGSGGVGPRGQCAADVLYAPGRVPGPLKRTGDRGAGWWQPVSWDEALGSIAASLALLRSAGTPERVAVMCGRERGVMVDLWARFCRAYGTPNFFETARRGRQSADAQAARLTMGATDLPAYDLANSNYVVGLGAALFEGNCLVQSLRGRAAGRPVARRTKYVQIESAYSLTAAGADEFVAVKPGTLDLFAYAVAHVLLKEGLYDRAFVESHCFGFSDWTEPDGTSHTGLEKMVEEITPALAAERCGVSPGAIVRLAREAASRRPAVFVVDDRSTAATNGLSVARAALAVNALLGSIDRPGGVILQRPAPLSPWPDPELDAVATAPRPRLDAPTLLRHPLAQADSDAIAEAASPPAALFLYYSNPLYSSVDPTRFRRALDKVPLVVSFSPFHDETTAQADFVLPDHTFLERFEDATPAPSIGRAALGLRQPVVQPVHDTRNTGDVVLALAARLGGSVGASLPWKDFQAALMPRLDGLRGSAEGSIRAASSEEFAARLLEVGHWAGAPYRYDEPLRTPSGKFEFFSQEALARVRALTPQVPSRQVPTPEALDRLCLGAPSESRWLGDPSHYPLYFLPYHPVTQGVGGPLVPHLRELGDVLTGSRWTAAAELNPRTAAAAGIADGDAVIVESQAGRFRTNAKLFEGVPPDGVRMAIGYGHAAGSAAAGGRGANPCEILTADAVTQLGGPALWSMRVRVERAPS